MKYILINILLLFTISGYSQFSGGRLQDVRMNVNIGSFTSLGSGIYSGSIGTVGSTGYTVDSIQIGDILFDENNIFRIDSVTVTVPGSIAAIKVTYRQGTAGTTSGPVAGKGFVIRPTVNYGLLLLTQWGSNFITNEQFAKALTHNFMVLDSLSQSQFLLYLGDTLLTSGDTIPRTICEDQLFTSFPLDSGVVVTAFELSTTATLDVYLNGNYVTPNNYTISGDTLYFNSYSFDTADKFYVKGCTSGVVAQSTVAYDYILPLSVEAHNVSLTTSNDTLNFIYSFPQHFNNKDISEVHVYFSSPGNTGSFIVNILLNNVQIGTTTFTNTQNDRVITLTKNITSYDKLKIAVSTNNMTTPPKGLNLNVKIID